MKVVHLLCGPFKIRVGHDARSRCGLIANVVGSNVGPTRYEMIASNGNPITGAMRPEIVTCKKCINLNTIGTTHVRPRRTADTTPVAKGAHVRAGRARHL